MEGIAPLEVKKQGVYVLYICHLIVIQYRTYDIPARGPMTFDFPSE